MPGQSPQCIHESRNSISGVEMSGRLEFLDGFSHRRDSSKPLSFSPSSRRKKNPSPLEHIRSGSSTWVFFPGNRDWLSETPPELCFVLPRRPFWQATEERGCWREGVSMPPRRTQNLHYLIVLQHPRNFIPRKRLR